MLINASCEEGILDDSDDDDDDDDRGDGDGDGDGKDEVDNMAEDSGEDSEMDSEEEKGEEAPSGKRRSRKAILDSLSFPEYLQDVKLILSTFDCRIRGRRTLSTVDFQSSETMFDCCTKCVDKYRDLFGDVIEGISDLLSVIDQYQIGITTEAKKQIISKMPGNVV